MEPDLYKLLIPARAAREQVDTFVPIIVWQTIDGDPIMALVPPRIGDIGKDLSAALEDMQEQFGSPIWFSVTCDAYAKGMMVEEGAMIEELIPGDLGVAFKEGDPAVVEQLVIACATNDGVGMARQVYRHTPVDGWEWDEPLPFTQRGDVVKMVMERVPLR